MAFWLSIAGAIFASTFTFAFRLKAIIASTMAFFILIPILFVAIVSTIVVVVIVVHCRTPFFIKKYIYSKHSRTILDNSRFMIIFLIKTGMLLVVLQQNQPVSFSSYLLFVFQEAFVYVKYHHHNILQ